MMSLPLSLSLPVHPHHLYYKMEETKVPVTVLFASRWRWHPYRLKSESNSFIIWSVKTPSHSRKISWRKKKPNPEYKSTTQNIWSLWAMK
jgi:hypothetical protein